MCIGADILSKKHLFLNNSKTCIIGSKPAHAVTPTLIVSLNFLFHKMKAAAHHFCIAFVSPKSPGKNSLIQDSIHDIEGTS